ncbi:sensor domain-containing diguanylate cyclase [Clostridium uliginosum]|uniref:Diguanylate cyclase (GGDEF) domain-containing protein n=1 Tax=Clostridium uliginosum TaxID=119641 RepID=A0A1I1SJ89_9CLOT|nr:sensor domain-containing diguanylate cyclase [Clostridium uliginosum]SFD46501.1 diguanylate cyclase (GGDEF) domain-containing protein [Clostridium uliginosum]
MNNVYILKNDVNGMLYYLGDFINNHKKILTIICIFIALSLLDAFWCFLVNIKEQRKFMKELELEREKYLIVIEQLNDIIFDFDLINKKVICSPKFKEKFGRNLTPREFDIINSSNSNIHPKDIILIKNLINNIDNNKKLSIIKQIRIRKNDEEYLWCELRLNYIRRNNKIVRIIGRITDIDNDVREREILKVKSECDQLTGLYNKLTFFNKVEEKIKNNENNENILIFIDLDNFKTVNDYLGHIIGDEVLKDTAQKINSIFNKENNVNARFGGDEFCVFEENSSILMIKEKIKRLSKLLEESYIGKNNEKVSVSASIGIASYPYNGTSLKELIEKADRALYKSKENGKNQITIYNESIRISV